MHVFEYGLQTTARFPGFARHRHNNHGICFIQFPHFSLLVAQILYKRNKTVTSITGRRLQRNANFIRQRK